MAKLTFTEKEQLEKIFEMQSGFVLDFSNWKFKDFVFDSVKLDIYSEKYAVNGESKARRMRVFWKIEPDEIVGKLIKDLLHYISEAKNTNDTLFKRCDEIANRLLSKSSLEIHFDEEDDSILLAELIQDSVNRDFPAAGLDRLHTYTTKLIRKICRNRGINIQNKNGTKLEYKPLHSLFGEYIKDLEKRNEIKSKTTILILKSSISIFEKFNKTRNDESLAHDNEILNKNESLIIIKYIIETLTFIKKIEKEKIDNFKIGKDLPDKLRSQILISEVIRKKVNLKQRGKEFHGLCPFHKEKTPSFTVNDQKGFYHCFGCGAHGDIIEFTMKNEQIDYKNSIIKLINEFSILI